MLYDVDIEASACVLSSRYAMLCYANSSVGLKAAGHRRMPPDGHRTSFELTVMGEARGRQGPRPFLIPLPPSLPSPSFSSSFPSFSLPFLPSP